MTEKLLHFIWQFQHFNRQQLATTDGEPLQVIYPGKLNHHQGPDFLEAQIKIGATTLAGSVELHLKTSDWEKHGHTADPNYNNVVLHVVFQNDTKDFKLPVLVLEPRISNALLKHYAHLMEAANPFACSASIGNIKPLTWESWKERLVAERLTRKAERVFSYLKKNNTHWEEAFWWMLARNFGSTVNSEAFEELAQSVPINVIAKHRNNLAQLEALLFGQANLLNSEMTDDWGILLQREYNFLKSKWNLSPIHTPVHFLRMRPSNFPTIRLAQLAMLLHSSTHLFSKIIETESAHELKNLLSVLTSDYWNNHYRFNEASVHKEKRLGESMLNNLLINTVAPAVFAYGLYQKNTDYTEKAVRLLERLAPEVNNITADFKKEKLTLNSAFDSQAFIELKTNYCSQKRCLECAVGNAILKNQTQV